MCKFVIYSFLCILWIYRPTQRCNGVGANSSSRTAKTNPAMNEGATYCSLLRTVYLSSLMPAVNILYSVDLNILSIFVQTQVFECFNYSSKRQVNGLYRLPFLPVVVVLQYKVYKTNEQE